MVFGHESQKPWALLMRNIVSYYRFDVIAFAAPGHATFSIPTTTGPVSNCTSRRIALLSSMVTLANTLASSDYGAVPYPAWPSFGSGYTGCGDGLIYR